MTLSQERRRIMEEFQRLPLDLFWGSPFDVRFYLASRIRKIERGTMLDIGCGTGILLRERNQRRVFGIGIDISMENLKTSKKTDGSLECVVSDMHYLPFKQEAFDHVIIANSFSSLELEIDRKQYTRTPYIILIDEVSRVLGKNGILLATTPNHRHRYYRKKRKADYETLEKCLQPYFEFKIYGFNPLPITLPRALDVKAIGTFYMAFLQLAMKLPLSRYLGMFFFIEATKKS
jgi:ubiquinone/menaquinone biosynthesis C-methylase UbiE